MSRKLLSLLILVSLASSAFGARMPTIPFNDSKPGITFPATLGPLSYRGIKHYEPEALGVSVRYDGEDSLKADIFIYDMGEKILGTGLQSPAVREHFQQVKGDIYTGEKKGYYASVRHISEREIALQTAGGTIPALSAVFTFRLTEEPGTSSSGVRVSHLVLTAYRDTFLKIRFTYPQSQAQRGGLAFKQFMADLARQLH